MQVVMDSDSEFVSEEESGYKEVISVNNINLREITENIFYS